jgi:hypothetical protein|uniref:Uncharacterized protein n=1 Tax=Geobacillus sp. enrichment culture clone fosmid MGS-MG1 TaxID=1549354 RepID=A0A0B5KBZ5_9BACL|nr:hypothetical protein [Geobacillus sp. enrichment culture clone fosmid MGS-MG1]
MRCNISIRLYDVQKSGSILLYFRQQFQRRRDKHLHADLKRVFVNRKARVVVRVNDAFFYIARADVEKASDLHPIVVGGDRSAIARLSPCDQRIGHDVPVVRASAEKGRH